MDILRDREWHCVTREVEQKDDRARVTTIRRKLQTVGYDVESRPCTLHEHKANILMRRIIKFNSAMSREDYVRHGQELVAREFPV